ncbi:hypothetical protein INT48_001269 [Thamnidium elegans]|uniref:Allantoicase domain-containing protein n=1 Tax=Thamnidium elegans TaxID=101142 RepID=A0A8H7SP50_9FUNG|nr:hypothetical protein INT48_001269 [Thamnidium elegans]
MSKAENNAPDIKDGFIYIDNNDEDDQFFKDHIDAMNRISATILADRENSTEENIHNPQPEDGNDTLNRSSYKRLDACYNLNDTPFATKIDLAADYQGSYIMYVSDQTFGSAGNIIRTDVLKEKKELWEIENEEADGWQNGWLVKRHEPSAFAVVQLGVGGIVSGIDIDLTGYNQCAPTTVSIIGHLRDSPGKWVRLLPQVFVDLDSHNFFETRNPNICSHIQVTMIPGSAITRLRVYGDVVPLFIPIDRTINLASNLYGSQVIQKPVNILRGEIPNIILDRAYSSHDGWICTRDKNSNNIPQYTTIKLATKGIIDRFVVDTKHFIGNAPQSIIIQGSMITDQNVNDSESVQWINLIDEDQIRHNIYPNMIHIISCIHSEPITHIRVRPIPDGGIQQLVAKGKVFLQNKLPQPATSSKRKREEKDKKGE